MSHPLPPEILHRLRRERERGLERRARSRALLRKAELQGLARDRPWRRGARRVIVAVLDLAGADLAARLRRPASATSGSRRRRG
jgi:hypothetical protein